MRDFTEEEKELIINTKITIDCFEKWNDYHYEQIRLEHFPHPSLKKEKLVLRFVIPLRLWKVLLTIVKKSEQNILKQKMNIILTFLFICFRIVTRW